MSAFRFLGSFLALASGCVAPYDAEYMPVQGSPLAPAGPTTAAPAVPVPPPLLPAAEGVGAPAGKGAAAADFLRMEEGLLAAPLTVNFDIEAEGAVSAHMRGAWHIAPGGLARLAVEGTYAGEPIELRLTSDGTTVQVALGDHERELPAGAGLHEALVVGWTRMGFLHNLAALCEGFHVDHGEGGVRDWVKVTEVVRGIAGPGEPERPFVFGIEVSGHPAGEASLYTDPTSGRPLERRQVVHFPSGDLRVRETYSY